MLLFWCCYGHQSSAASLGELSGRRHHHRHRRRRCCCFGFRSLQVNIIIPSLRWINNVGRWVFVMEFFGAVFVISRHKSKNVLQLNTISFLLVVFNVSFTSYRIFSSFVVIINSIPFDEDFWYCATVFSVMMSLFRSHLIYFSFLINLSSYRIIFFSHSNW